MIAAGRYPELVDALVLICPGLHPRLGVSRRERLQIAWAFLTNRRKRFPIPLSDPALFTANPQGQAFIAADPYSIREGPRACWPPASSSTGWLRSPRAASISRPC